MRVEACSGSSCGTSAHGPDKGYKLASAGTDASPSLLARHNGSPGQTGAELLKGSMTEKKWLLLCQRHRNSGIGRMRISSLCPSALGPPKVGPGFCPELRLAYSRTRCLPLRRRSQRSKVGLNIRRDVALCTVRKWEFPILLYMDPTLNRVGRFCDVSSKIKFIYILHLKER